MFCLLLPFMAFFDGEVFDSTVAASDGEVLLKGTDVAFRKACSCCLIVAHRTESGDMAALRSRERRSRKPWRANWQMMTRRYTRLSV